VRRQFGPEGNEFPVLEYQMQQWRLLPYLAATYIVKCFGRSFFENLVNFVMSQFNSDYTPEKIATWGAEMHAISSSMKPLAGWLARDAIQECREACGGHGYLSCAGIGRLRDDNDANCTYEGDNNVLLQQTSNWLLTIWAHPNKEKLAKEMPLNTLSFMSNLPKNFKFRAQTKQDLMNPHVLLNTYKWLIGWLTESTANKYQSILKESGNSFSAKNDSQIYHARNLSLAFIEHYILERFWNVQCCDEHIPENIRNIFKRMMLLYGWWSLEKHLTTLYQGGLIQGAEPAALIKATILDLCTLLKPEAVALVDAIAPPDFILNSALGKSDGLVYKNLQLAMSQTPGGYERPVWWKDVATKIATTKANAKL